MICSILHCACNSIGWVQGGYATTFFLPFENLFLLFGELQRLDEEVASNQERCDFPSNGEQLMYIVQVLPNANDGDKRDNVKHFIHQARGPRRKVVESILAITRVGRCACAHISVDADVRNASKLPEHCGPERHARFYRMKEASQRR